MPKKRDWVDDFLDELEKRYGPRVLKPVQAPVELPSDDGDYDDPDTFGGPYDVCKPGEHQWIPNYEGCDHFHCRYCGINYI